MRVCLSPADSVSDPNAAPASEDNQNLFVLSNTGSQLAKIALCVLRSPLFARLGLLTLVILFQQQLCWQRKRERRSRFVLRFSSHPFSPHSFLRSFVRLSL